MLRRARRIRGADEAARVLGTGERVTVQDTIWVAARHGVDTTAP
ncbi:hypothetical protein [Dactylosporangium sp. CA-233914]